MKGQLSIEDVMPSAVTREWLYDEDNGCVLCRCPVCEGRMIIDIYTYWNPYHFCPYCGEKLNEGAITSKRVTVYGKDRATEMRVRSEHERRTNGSV